MLLSPGSRLGRAAVLIGVAWLAPRPGWCQGVEVVPRRPPEQPVLVAQSSAATRDAIVGLAFAGQELVTVTSGGAAAWWDVVNHVARQIVWLPETVTTAVLAGPPGRLVVGSVTGLTLYECLDGGVLRLDQQPLRGVRGMAAHPATGRLIVAGDTGLSEWRLEGGSLRARTGAASQQTSASAVSLSADGRAYAALIGPGGKGEAISVGRCDGLRETYRLEYPGLSPSAVALSPDGRFLAVANRMQPLDLRLWDLTSKALVRAWVRHLDPVESLVFTADGQGLWAGDRHGDVRLWSAGREAPALGWRETAPISALAPQPEGLRLGIGTAGSGPTVRAARDGSLLVRLSGRADQLATAMFVGGSSHLALGGGPLTALFDLTSLQITGRHLLPDPAPNYRAEVRDVVAVGDRLVYALTGGWVGRLGEQGQPPTALSRQRAAPGADLGGLGDHPRLAACAGGQWLGCGGADGTVSVLDPATSRRCWAIRAHLGPVAVQWLNEGRYLLSVGLLDEHWIRWDAQTGQPVAKGDLPAAPQRARLTAVAATPDGARLAMARRDGSVSLVQMERGEVLWSQDPAGDGHASRPPGDLDLSPDGRLVVVSDGSVTVRDLTRGALVRRLDDDGSVSGAFSSDGRWWVSVIRTGEVVLRRTIDWQPVVTILSHNLGAGWLAVTPDGYFDASLGAEHAVAWRLGGRILPFDQFEESFLRPDRVRARVAGEQGTSQPDLANWSPPSLDIVSPEYGAGVPGATLELRLIAAGAVPVEQVIVTVNGRPLPPHVARQLEFPGSDQRRRECQATIPLPPGESRCRIRAVAYDRERRRSGIAEVTVFRAGVADDVGLLHVLAIGINRYPRLPARFGLRYAVADAQAVAACFERFGQRRPYQQVKTHLLVDEQATVSNLKFALRGLKDTATENDVAVVFVAGHGVLDREGGYLFPSFEMDVQQPATTALGWQDFAGALREIRAKRTLVLADTCRSGSLVGAGAADSVLARRLNRDANQAVLAASGSRETSQEREAWGHGAFSKALIEALDGRGDADRDGRVTIRELRDFVTARVRELTDGRQNPEMPYLENFDPEAVLGLVATKPRR